MPNDLLPALLLAALGAVGLALLYHRFAGRPNAPADDQPLHLRGRGTETTRPFALAPGSYKLAYTLPDDSLTAVTLLDTTTGDSDMLGVRKGTGATSIAINAPGRYALRVEPADELAAWTLTLSPLGLPSLRP